jgi:hypothetical protein
LGQGGVTTQASATTQTTGQLGAKDALGQLSIRLSCST